MGVAAVIVCVCAVCALMVCFSGEGIEEWVGAAKKHEVVLQVWRITVCNHSFVCRENLKDWLEVKFARLGLEVYRQNYTASRPAVTGQQVL